MLHNKKNECPVCGKEIVYAQIVKEDGKTTHRAYHAEEVPRNATVIDMHAISPTYRKRLRDAISHVSENGKPVFDATGMNRIVMITEAINIMKENGMNDDQARELRSRMLAKGNGFVEDIELAKPYLTIIRN